MVVSALCGRNLGRFNYVLSRNKNPEILCLVAEFLSANEFFDAALKFISPNSVGDNGMPPLYIVAEEQWETACRHLDRQLAAARYLLARGADVNAASPDIPSPMYVAVLRGNQALVALFMEAGADVNYAFRACSVLKLAAYTRSARMVELVLAGATPRTLEAVSKMSIESGRAEVAAVLLKVHPFDVKRAIGLLRWGHLDMLNLWEVCEGPIARTPAFSYWFRKVGAHYNRLELLRTLFPVGWKDIKKQIFKFFAPLWAVAYVEGRASVSRVRLLGLPADVAAVTLAFLVERWQVKSALEYAHTFARFEC